jgi:hypothetical protein
VKPRRPPELIIRLPLEESEGQVILAADSLEDEVALRAWLLRSRIVGRLPVLVRRLLLELDHRDREEGAA